jgi:hypothetical protein
VKRSAVVLVLATGLVVFLRKPATRVLNQMRGTMVRTEHRSDEGSVAHEGPESPSL